MMAAIKVATFRMWPLSCAKDEKSAWKKCTKLIDGSDCQLYRAKNPEKPEQN